MPSMRRELRMSMPSGRAERDPIGLRAALHGNGLRGTMAKSLKGPRLKAWQRCK